MYRGELNPNGVAARCGGRTKPRGCCGHHSQRDFDCAVPTLGLDDAIPGVEDPCKVQCLLPLWISTKHAKKHTRPPSINGRNERHDHFAFILGEGVKKFIL